jgi:predicted lipoprotein with Yx(FWY)xxD motif
VWFLVDPLAKLVPPDAKGSGPAAPAPTAAPPSTAVPATAAPATAAPTAPPATTAPAAATLRVADSALGQILVGPDGRTLYAFTNDEAGTTTCLDACAVAWPPLPADGIDLAAVSNSGLLTTVDRPDGSKQVKAGKWPLYYFSGDAAPGETNGQGSGGKWFAVTPDGKLSK